jgi:hypothetical protein
VQQPVALNNESLNPTACWIHFDTWQYPGDIMWYCWTRQNQWKKPCFTSNKPSKTTGAEPFLPCKLNKTYTADKEKPSPIFKPNLARKAGINGSANTQRPLQFWLPNTGTKSTGTGCGTTTHRTHHQIFVGTGQRLCLYWPPISLQVGDKDYRLDLLFYHIRLRCFVVIDLKVVEFEPEFAGKMNFYLSAVDDQIKTADDQPALVLSFAKTKTNWKWNTPCKE